MLGKGDSVYFIAAEWAKLKETKATLDREEFVARAENLKKLISSELQSVRDEDKELVLNIETLLNSLTS